MQLLFLLQKIELARFALYFPIYGQLSNYLCFLVNLKNKLLMNLTTMFVVNQKELSQVTLTIR